ncbi:MAG: PTS sugar transporter subunit IIB [Hespellia sp.]|jgi:D-glucosaminate-specific PTS system IIB component|nr:PTS sugar transporter subunit IIB [Hespellia sp.]
MGNLVMTRCDHRLVHGQVGGQWLKRLSTKRIVILCDEVAKDPFMKEMFAVSAPAGVKIDCYTVEEGVAEWKKDQFGNGNIILLFKYTIDAVHAFDAGLDFKELNIGQSASGKDKDGNVRKLVLRAVYLSELEASSLRRLSKEKDVNVYSQGAPAEGVVQLIPMLDKAGL